MPYSDNDDFEMNFFDEEPEEEATIQEMKASHHAIFDWAAGGATDLMGDDMPQQDEEKTQLFSDVPEPDMVTKTVAEDGWTTLTNPEPEPEPEPTPQPQESAQPAEPAQPMEETKQPQNGHENNGHVVLISGGDRGIGAAAVRMFWQAGYRTAFFYHTNEDAARALVNELGCDCVAVQCDVADRAACEAAWKVVQRTVGEPDVLVCNAGVAQQKLFTDITEADWQHMIGVDLTGVFHLCQLALPDMIRNKYGRILTVSSMWGQTGGSCEVHYSAAKAGVIGLTKALAKEEGPSGITVNCVAPGVIETDMMRSFTAEDKAALAEETPVQRLGTPEEVARMLVFLADEKAGFITGQILGVNGGLVI